MTTLIKHWHDFAVGINYKTRDGHVVRLICTDRQGVCFQMIGLCTNCHGEENIVRYQSTGHYLMTKEEFRLDLIEEIVL